MSRARVIASSSQGEYFISIYNMFKCGHQYYLKNIGNKVNVPRLYFEEKLKSIAATH